MGVDTARTIESTDGGYSIIELLVPTIYFVYFYQWITFLAAAAAA